MLPEKLIEFTRSKHFRKVHALNMAHSLMEAVKIDLVNIGEDAGLIESSQYEILVMIREIMEGGRESGT